MNPDLRYCLFCRKDRLEEGEELWKSDIIISPSKTSSDIIFTICPSCRKKNTIDEVYGKLMDQNVLMLNLKKINMEVIVI